MAGGKRAKGEEWVKALFGKVSVSKQKLACPGGGGSIGGTDKKNTYTQ